MTLSIEGTTVYLDRAAVLDLGRGPIDPTVLSRAIDTRLEPPRVAALRAPPALALSSLRPLVAAVAGPGRVQSIVLEVPPCPVVLAVGGGEDPAARTVADLSAACLRPGPAARCALDLTSPGAR